jgi:AraC-like DNA-binding protein
MEQGTLLHTLMERTKIFFLIFVSLISAATISAQNEKNPFLAFANKPYAEYHYDLRDTIRMRYKTPTEACLELTVKQLKSVPDVFHNGQWEMEAKFFSLKFRYKHLMTLSDKKYEAGLLDLLKESTKKSNKVWELRITRQLFDYYVDKDRLYDMAIFAHRLKQYFSIVSSKEFPDIIDCKYKLGTVYLEYNNLVQAEKYFREVIASPMILPIQQIYVQARNDMGIIARNNYHDLNASDKWFLSIRAFYNKYHITYIADEWEAVMTGNLGTNQMLRRNYKEAISLLTKAFDAKYGMEDYNYSFLMAYELANCYCELGKYDVAEKYITKAKECYDKGNLSVESSKTPGPRQQYFMVLNKYYTGIGDTHTAYAWLDSARVDREKYYQHYNTNLFYLVEQKESSDELKNEEAETHTYKVVFTISFCILIMIIILLTTCYILLQKKRAAYNKLVERNRKIADQVLTVNDNINEEKDIPIDEEKSDDEVLEKVKNYIINSQCYLDTNLTISMLARKIGMNRTYLSNAINSDGNNYNTFINQFRVSYAIQILSSEPDTSIEDIAFSSGFNNRKSMYNAFKLITGLTPSQFKN